MPTWVPILITLGLFLASASLGFAFRTGQQISTIKAQCAFYEGQLKCIPDMQQQIAAQAQNTEVFWKIIGPHMSGIIASPHAVNRDHLVNRLDEGSLTYAQALELSSILGHALDEEKDNTRRVALAFKLAQTRCLLNEMDRQRTRKSEEVTRQCRPPISPML